jgi:hypothetical protein
VSPISIHLRRALVSVPLSLEINQRCTPGSTLPILLLAWATMALMGDVLRVKRLPLQRYLRCVVT